MKRIYNGKIFTMKRIYNEKIARLYKRNVSGRVSLPPGTELRPVSFNKRQQNEELKHFTRNFHGARMFPQCFPVSHKGNIVSRVSVCFQDANYAYPTRQEILTKIRACEHFQTFCEHKQASTHLTLPEQFEQRPSFASTFILDGTIRKPYFFARFIPSRPS